MRGYFRVCPYFLYKLLHKSLEATITEGLSQTADYMDWIGTDWSKIAAESERKRAGRPAHSEGSDGFSAL